MQFKEFKMRKVYGHGDVILKETNSIPEDAKKMPYTQ